MCATLRNVKRWKIEPGCLKAGATSDICRVDASSARNFAAYSGQCSAFYFSIRSLRAFTSQLTLGVAGSP